MVKAAPVSCTTRHTTMRTEERERRAHFTRAQAHRAHLAKLHHGVVGVFLVVTLCCVGAQKRVCVCVRVELFE